MSYECSGEQGQKKAKERKRCEGLLNPKAEYRAVNLTKKGLAKKRRKHKVALFREKEHRKE